MHLFLLLAPAREEDDEALRRAYLGSTHDLDGLAHALRVHPASVVARRQALRPGSGQALGLYRPDEFAAAVADLISYCVGCLFGRWDIRIGAGEVDPPSLPDPEEGLPLYPPGALTPTPRPDGHPPSPLPNLGEGKGAGGMG